MGGQRYRAGRRCWVFFESKWIVGDNSTEETLVPRVGAALYLDRCGNLSMHFFCFDGQKHYSTHPAARGWCRIIDFWTSTTFQGQDTRYNQYNNCTQAPRRGVFLASCFHDFGLSTGDANMRFIRATEYFQIYLMLRDLYSLSQVGFFPWAYLLYNWKLIYAHIHPSSSGIVFLTVYSII